jgi:hypothetical protein
MPNLRLTDFDRMHPAILEYHLRPLPGYTFLVQPIFEALSIRQWRKNAIPPPPRSIKASVIRRYAGDRNVFVETGTFYGDMLATVQEDFARLYSIELHPRLARRAQRRFKRHPQVTIVHGNSATHLEPVLREADAPVVLWLDGHYSGILTARGETGDTPIVSELEVALRAGTSEDVILIDDARLFGTDPAYPTVAEVERRVVAARPHYSIRVDDDIIQIHPA